MFRFSIKSVDSLLLTKDDFIKIKKKHAKYVGSRVLTTD